MAIRKVTHLKVMDGRIDVYYEVHEERHIRKGYKVPLMWLIDDELDWGDACQEKQLLW